MTGNLVIPPQFDEMEGDAVRIGTKWGFIDKNAKVVIEPQFDAVWLDYEGMSAVLVGEKWGFVNIASQAIINPQFDEVSFFSDELCAVGVSRSFEP